MHIAYNAWFWDQLYTGSGQYLRQLVKALRQLEPGLKISLVMPHWIAAPDEVPPGVDVIPIKVTNSSLIGKVWFEQRLYPAAAGRLGADIAHVPYWGAPLTSPAPLVVTVHDVIPLSMPVYRGGIGARLYFSLARATARGAGRVITDSEFSRQEIVKLIGCPAERVTSILLAVGPELHPRLGAERDSEIRQKYDLPERYALYLGSFEVRKNLRALLAAYTYVGSAVGEEYPLVLAGKAPGNWGSPRFPDLRAEIAEKPELAQYIRWIGPVDEADKPGIYRMARVFAFPSRYEGFGLGPLEAMACGTPVVAADASSVPEVVGESAYLVDPDDSRAMGAALISVLIQDDLHDSLRNAGLARASNFSWERTARETLQVYERVLADKS
jgi:glycosyltransferase involved in cell wall biosynthesis